MYRVTWLRLGCIRTSPWYDEIDRAETLAFWLMVCPGCQEVRLERME